MNRVRIFTLVREVNNFSNMYKNCVQLYKNCVHELYLQLQNNIILLNIIKVLGIVRSGLFRDILITIGRLDSLFILLLLNDYIETSSSISNHFNLTIQLIHQCVNQFQS